MKPSEIDLHDPAVLQAFTDGRFGGIFQYDTPGSRRLCRNFTFRTFMDVATITALNRPGPAKSGLAVQFVERAMGRAPIPPQHPKVEAVFRETCGVPVFQEQVIRLTQDVAGFTVEEGDKFRKAVAKKKGLEEIRDKFIQGAVVHAPMSEKEAIDLYRSIENFASYAFNLSHSVAYGMTAFWMMYLKVHRPAAFYRAALSTEPKPPDQVRLAAEARRSGIPVGPPDVCFSEEHFGLRAGDHPEIVGRLADIKGVGAATATMIAAARPFQNLQDFYDRTAGAGVRGMTVKTFRLLAQTTAFRSLFPHQRILVQNADLIWDLDMRASKIPDLNDSEIVDLAAPVYPLYASLNGTDQLSLATDRIHALANGKRPILSLDEIDLDVQETSLVVGYLGQFRIFHGDPKVGQAILSCSSGRELTCRIDADVLEPNLARLKAGTVLLAVVSTTGRGGARLEWLRDARELVEDDLDPVATYLLRPPDVKDHTSRLTGLGEGKCLRVCGIIIRARRHQDKKDRWMKTVTLAGPSGFARFLVFSRRCEKRDSGRLREGRDVEVRLERFCKDGICLSDTEVRRLDQDTDKKGLPKPISAR